MDELYKKYGEYMIQLEVIQARVLEVKRQIAEGLNKPKEPALVNPTEECL